MDIPKNLKNLADTLPFDLYIAGGYLRNAFLKLPYSDIDIAGAVPSQTLKTYLPAYASFSHASEKMDTSIIILDGEKYEYTPFRTESYTGGNHTPDTVTFCKDPYLDSLRRDFTCNALYYNLKTQEVLDFHNGVKDTNNRILRAVDNAQKVFSEDGLRIMRLARLAAQLDFEIDSDTFSAAKKYKDNLKDISKERIRDELMLILNADQKYGVKEAHYRGLKILEELDVFSYIIPELNDAKGVKQRSDFHKYDVLEHILTTVKYADEKVRLAALMHDIGKPLSKKQDGNMYRHPELGKQIIKNRLGENGLKFSSSVIKETALLTELHMYDISQLTKPLKLRFFVADNWEYIDKLMLLIKADGLGSGMEYKDRTWRFKEQKEYILKYNLPVKLKDLKINGDDLQRTFPDIIKNRIGEVLKNLLKDCLSEVCKNEKTALLNRAEKYINNKGKK